MNLENQILRNGYQKMLLSRSSMGSKNSLPGTRGRGHGFFIRPQLAFFCKELIVVIAFFFILLLSPLVYSSLIKERTSKDITLGSWQGSTLILLQRDLPGETPSQILVFKNFTKVRRISEKKNGSHNS